MEGIPEKSVVGVGTDRIGYDAWVGDVGEAEVGGVGGYGLEEAEDVEATDMNALKKLLDEEKVVERFVGGECGLVGEGGVGLCDRKKTDVEKIRDKKVFGA